MNAPREQKLLEKIVKVFEMIAVMFRDMFRRLRFEDVPPELVVNITADFFGLVAFSIFVLVTNADCYVALVALIIWFMFVVWCFDRHYKKA